jgi:hypothetical protein
VTLGDVRKRTRVTGGCLAFWLPQIASDEERRLQRGPEREVRNGFGERQHAIEAASARSAKRRTIPQTIIRGSAPCGWQPSRYLSRMSPVQSQFVPNQHERVEHLARPAWKGGGTGGRVVRVSLSARAAWGCGYHR